MSLRLSQDQVDELLHGTVPQPPNVQPYDFLRPPRIPRVKRGALEARFARLGFGVQCDWTARLRAPVDVAVVSVEQALFSECVLSLGQPCAAFLLDLGHATGARGVLDLGLETGIHFVERAFGGAGDATHPRRPLTAIEQTLVRDVAQSVAAHLREAWHGTIALAPRLLGFESDPELLGVARPEDSMLVVVLQARAPGLSGLVTLCLPLEPFADFLREPRAEAPAAAPLDGERRGQVERRVRGACLDVVARWPVFRLSAREVSALGPGQIIQTGHPADTPVELHVNDRVCFRGAVGHQQRRLGVRISEWVPAGTEQRADRGRAGRVQ